MCDLSEFPERYRDILEYMPSAILNALREGSSAEYDPTKEIGAGENWRPYYCDDCDSYHKTDYWSTYRAEDGKLIMEVHSTDQDGNSEYEDEAEVGTEDYARINAEYFEGADKEWLAYSKWVAERGVDPLGEFIIKVKRPLHFKVKFRKGINGVYFFGARRVDHGHYEQDCKEIREFCMVNDQNLVEIAEMTTEEVWDLLLHCEQLDGQKLLSELVMTAVLKIEVPYSEEHQQRQLRAAARKHVRQETAAARKQQRQAR